MIKDTSLEIRNIIGGVDYYTPSGYKPSPRQKDYDYGYIDRYFVGKINQPEMFIETSVRDYNLTDSRLYKKIAIKWKISGTEFNVYQNSILQNVGVVEYNMRRINDVVMVFSNGYIILNNPKQFWRGF